MRTKALLLGAMIGAASLATSMAQVYSVNIVGYVNTTLYRGFNMIQNPLNNTAGNTLDNILPTFTGNPSYIRLYKWDPTANPPQYLVNIWTDGAWDDGSMVLNPGDGFYLYNPTANPITVTFVGEVMTGNLSQNVYRGFNMIGSQVPQQGTIQTDLGYIATGTYERVYMWDATMSPPQYLVFTWDPSGGWDPEEPILQVGQSVLLYRTAAASTWNRTFNVGP